MAQHSESVFTIPDLLVSWPWDKVPNPDFDNDVEDEANAWVESMDLFQPAQLEKFKTYKINLLVSLSGPILGRGHLRVSCDLMNLFFVFDEYTDVANKDEVWKISQGVMAVFRGQKPSTGNTKITEMARQFLERTIGTIGHDAPGLERFIIDFNAYMLSIIQEADDRMERRIRKVDDYLVLRRDTCAIKAVLSFYGLGLRIPHEVFEHPLMVSLTEHAADLVAISNDMHSYALERTRGLDGHNVITSIMHEHGLNLQDAIQWLAAYACETIEAFKCARFQLPSWGPETDNAVGEYIGRMGRCVRGCDAWSYETVRYYGSEALEIQKKPEDHVCVGSLTPEEVLR